MNPMLILGAIQAIQALTSKDKDKESKAGKIGKVAGAVSSLAGSGSGAAANAAGTSGTADAFPFSGAPEAGSNLRGPMMPLQNTRMQGPAPAPVGGLAPPTGPTGGPRMPLTPRGPSTFQNPFASQKRAAVNQMGPSDFGPRDQIMNLSAAERPIAPPLQGPYQGPPSKLTRQPPVPARTFSPSGSAAQADAMKLSPAEQVSLAREAGKMADETAAILTGGPQAGNPKLQRPARQPLMATSPQPKSPGTFAPLSVQNQPVQMGGPAMAPTPPTPQADRAQAIQDFIQLLAKKKWQGAR